MVIRKRAITLLIVVAALVGIGTGCADKGACRVRPPGGDPCGLGACDAVVGYYFDGEQCRAASGCGCDECCRAEIAPFATEEDCSAACE